MPSTRNTLKLAPPTRKFNFQTYIPLCAALLHKIRRKEERREGEREREKKIINGKRWYDLFARICFQQMQRVHTRIYKRNPALSWRD